MAKDAISSLESIISLGIERYFHSIVICSYFSRILTSGQESSCLEGLDLLTNLIQRANDRIIIMPGGGITLKNINKIVQTCKAKEVHVSGRLPVDSPMVYKNSACFMGGALRNSEFSRSIVSSSVILGFKENASKK
jgi:copper homeostasis protein